MSATLEIRSDPAELAKVRDFLRRQLRRHEFTDEMVDLLVLGVDEACTNVIRHAYENRSNQPVIVKLDVKGDNLLVKVRDYGKDVPTQRCQHRELDDVRPGGLGLLFMQKAFDEVKYESQSRGTELLLRKHLNAAAA